MVWKMNYGICSSACAIGTAFFILAQDSPCWKKHYPEAPSIPHIERATCLDILMFYWTLTYGILLLKYLWLLFDYVRHNQNRVLPDRKDHYLALDDQPETRPRG